MHNVEFFHYLLFLICGAGLLTWLAERIAIAPAVVLFAGGSAVALFGGQPAASMDPALVLMAILPPLLMSSAFYTAWGDFKRNGAAIASLALGAVVFTTVAVAAAVRIADPSLPWPACFALGAIVSPPDAVAAKAMLQRFPLPARLVTVLEGESLVNDASGLLLYQMAIAAALAGRFTAGTAASLFVTLTLVGIVTGVICGQVMMWLIRRLRDPMLCILLTFLMAWGSYAIAEALGGSGVLSVVACGLVLGVRQHKAFDAGMRIKAESTWETVVFVLDALVFILIGLSLHALLARMQADGALLRAGLDVALPAVGAVVAARLLWVGLAVYLPSRLTARPGGRPAWSFGESLVLGWAGMRGVVSLAAALALPEALPGRDVILFSTFVVIFATLVVQGLTLAPLIRLLKLKPGHRAAAMNEHEVRSHTFRASLIELRHRRAANPAAQDEDLDRLIGEYQIRVRNNENAHQHGQEHVDRRARQLRIELDLVGVSRQELLRLHRAGRVPDPVLHRIESELDFEELRLQRLLAP
ncbi:MAG TPA: sodium:proton antiporter [Bordetella sp.]